jgi:hypothetical protein
MRRKNKVNSEELKQSLMTEFEEQLKNVLDDVRQEMSQLQEKVEAEFQKYKSQLSDVFRDFSARIETEKPLEAGFSDSVVEHLRLARDEGARITATAIAETEEMQRAATKAEAQAEPKVGIGDLRDAINDISSQTSQSSILKTLVSHAEKFTARGAFFILKNEYFVGWQVFGSRQEESDDQVVRKIFFPLSAQTLLGESVRSLSAVESSYGTYEGDSAYLDKLEFGQPEQMFAIPLIARGRGVAVLYADGGEQNEVINVEALETLVRVAGLTVELLASAPGRSARFDAAPTQDYSDSAVSAQSEKADDEFETENDYQSAQMSSETSAAETYQSSAEFADSPTAVDYGSSYGGDAAESAAQTNYQSPSDNFSFQSASETAPQSFDSNDFQVQVVQGEEADAPEFQPARQGQETQLGYEQVETSGEDYSWNAQTENSSFAGEESYDSSKSETEKAIDFTQAAATVGQTAAASPVKSRFSDRNVDLPIEVSEDERGLHDDARHFAQLLVSEIKLYNEQKVKEGRDAHDLYERLREAIDRSREIYDKRVQPPVAAKFDYFHYELVSTLAEGEAEKLGGSYQQGATV